ncbi:preprotein translocase subunit SecE [Haloechinothrix salitolerans]|uniref:Protein translocase subunit SecE n=1 Tax=Haloechinothrix salitolerans TaxID=926830 RepID=A0ABW2C7R1_9PSEU
MSDDGEKDNGADEQRSSRPESAASRRARRRPAEGKGEPGGKGSVKGKSAGASPPNRTDGGSPAVTKRDRGEPKQPLPKRIVRYLREVVAELRKVIWPTRKQMVTYTIVVIVFVIFMVSLVALLDWGFGKVMFALFG